MLMKNDVTELNPIIGMADDYITNDLIFTSAGELVKVVVEKTEDTEWEHGDNVEW